VCPEFYGPLSAGLHDALSPQRSDANTQRKCETDAEDKTRQQGEAAGYRRRSQRPRQTWDRPDFARHSYSELERLALKGSDLMKSRTIIFATCLTLLCALASTAQVPSKPGPLKPNGPVKKTPVPNKPPATFPSAKSDLTAGVSVYVDAKEGRVVMGAAVVNNGPNALASGLRTLTLIVKNKGLTWTFFKDEKIPALKAAGSTEGPQAGSNYTRSHAVPLAWGFDDKTVYEVRISPSKADPKPSNDVATQVGPNKGKP
jgi:hypothetical protein